MLQSLGVCVFGCTLDQALAHRVHVLQLGLNAVHLLPLHRLSQREKRGGEGGRQESEGEGERGEGRARTERERDKGRR